MAAPKSKAGRLGCHGLVLVGSADRVVGSGTAFAVDGTGAGTSQTDTLSGYRAVCIVFDGRAG